MNIKFFQKEISRRVRNGEDPEQILKEMKQQGIDPKTIRKSFQENIKNTFSKIILRFFLFFFLIFTLPILWFLIREKFF